MVDLLPVGAARLSDSPFGSCCVTLLVWAAYWVLGRRCLGGPLTLLRTKVHTYRFWMHSNSQVSILQDDHKSTEVLWTPVCHLHC